MIKRFLKRYFLYLLFSLAFLGALIGADFIWNQNYLKYGTLAMWALNMCLFLAYTKHIRRKATQCSHCNLFVPLDNDANNPIPHCCYQKPKDGSR